MLDQQDRNIIAILQQDARISNVDLAARVNLTPGPCLRRVQRLEACGVIRGYRADIDPSILGRGFEMVLDVTMAVDNEAIAFFEETIAGHDQVVEVVRLFGAPDYLVRVAVPDLPSFETYLNESLSSIPGIQRLRARMRMKTITSTRSPRTPDGVGEQIAELRRPESKP